VENEDNQQTTLRDTIEQAIESETNEVVNDPIEKPERVRAPDGKFAATQEEIVSEEPAAPRAPKPSSWKKDYEEDWGKLDPKMQDYINQREQEYAKGVSTYKSQWDSAAPIYQAMAEHVLPDLQQHGIAPQQWIQDVSQAHKTLTYGSPQEKAQTLFRLANNYGVDLGQFAGMQVDPNYSMMAQELAQLKNQWNGFQTRQQQQEQYSIQSEIDAFKQDAKHFDVVRETMAGLLQSGVANDLQSAYDKAIRLHDDIFQQEQASQVNHAKEELAQKASHARAKAVSPKSAAPTGSMNSGNGKKSTRDILSEQLDAVMGGRL
jgi:hypothetical protein